MKLFSRLLLAPVLLALAIVATATPAAAWKVSTAAASAMLDAQKGRMAGGSIVIYSGTEPADPDTALSGNTVLATFTLNTPACGSDSTSGSYRVCTMSLAASTVTATASGCSPTCTATFARVYQSDGTTAEGDLTIGTSGADWNFGSTAIGPGMNVTLSSTPTLKIPVH